MNGRLYDVLTSSAEQRFLRAMRAELLAPLRGTIVEVGAGTGRSFGHYDRDVRLLALEPDPSMVAIAERRAKAARARIELVCQPDSALDSLAGHSADAIVFQLVLCSVPDPRLTLRRAKRVLRPGGAIVVLEHVRAPDPFGRIQDVLAPLWGFCCGNCRPNQATRSLFGDAGFPTGPLDERHVATLSLVRDFIVGRVQPVD